MCNYKEIVIFQFAIAYSKDYSGKMPRRFVYLLSLKGTVPDLVIMHSISVLFLSLCLLHIPFINSANFFFFAFLLYTTCYAGHGDIIIGKQVQRACFNEAYAVDLYVARRSANSQLK